MIKFKNDRKDTSPKQNFKYKHFDDELNVKCKQTFNLRYNGTTGEVEAKSTFPFSVWTVNIPLHSIMNNSFSFVENAAVFQMFKINSIRIETYSTYDPSMYTIPYSFGHLIYALRFYPSRQDWVGNPFKIIKDPKSLLVSTKKPLHFQETIFPRQYLTTLDSQGFGRWISTDYNLIYHDIEASLQIGNYYNGFWPEHIPIGTMTTSVDCSFRLFKG